MGISGNLKTMQLAELLQWLSMGQKTGTLRFEKGPPSDVTKRVFFSEGVIISSASTDPGEYLGRFLVSHGYLAEDEVNAAVARQQEEQQLLGKILVSMDLISEEDLHQMLRLKAEESIYDIFTWSQGAFEFLDDELPSKNMIPMQLDVQWIVLEGTRRTDEWNRIQQVISSPLCVPVLVTDLDALELEEFDRSLLEWVDDERSVEEISEGSMTNLFQVSDILAAQATAGTLKIVKPRIIEVPVPVSVSDADADEAGKVAKDADGAAVDSNESGSFFLPMMQRMMAQYQQQMMAGQQPASLPPGFNPTLLAQQMGQQPGQPAPSQAPQQAAQPAPPAAAPVSLGGGRSLSFATDGQTAAAPAAVATPTPEPAAPSQSPAEALVSRAESELQRGDLAASVQSFKQAKEDEGAASVANRIKAGEEKVVTALESRGVDLRRVPKLKCGMEELSKLDISPQEGFMLTRVDGSYDIKSILSMSPMPKAEALVLFWRLRESGHVGL